MTTKIVLSTLIATGVSVVAAQTGGSAKDQDLIGLTTPSVLDKGKALAGVQVNSFGASDNLLRTGFSFGYGLGNNLQARIAGTFSPFDTFSLTPGNVVRYGGSAGNFLLRYQLPGTIDKATAHCFRATSTALYRLVDHRDHENYSRSLRRRRSTAWIPKVFGAVDDLCMSTASRWIVVGSRCRSVRLEVASVAVDERKVAAPEVARRESVGDAEFGA